MEYSNHQPLLSLKRKDGKKDENQKWHMDLDRIEKRGVDDKRRPYINLLQPMSRGPYKLSLLLASHLLVAKTDTELRSIDPKDHALTELVLTTSAKCVSGHAPNTIHRGLVQDFSESNFVARIYKIAYGPTTEFIHTSRKKDVSYRLSEEIRRFIPPEGERKIELEIK